MRLLALLESVTVTPINDHVRFTINSDFDPNYYNKYIDIEFTPDEDDFADHLTRHKVSIKCIRVNVIEVKEYIKDNSRFHDHHDLINILNKKYYAQLIGNVIAVSNQEISKEDAAIYR